MRMYHFPEFYAIRSEKRDSACYSLLHNAKQGRDSQNKANMRGMCRVDQR